MISYMVCTSAHAQYHYMCTHQDGDCKMETCLWMHVGQAHGLTNHMPDTRSQPKPCSFDLAEHLQKATSACFCNGGGLYSTKWCLSGLHQHAIACIHR